MSYRLVSNQSEIEALLPELEAAREVALDTEADNMYHYHNRVCLLQIGLKDEIVLVDALADIDPGPLLAVLEKKHLVMHGSDFDLRLLAGLGGFAPKSLFDTMLAAQLLGHERFGLSSLVQTYFGLNLPKSHQKSDWSKRPLPDIMLDYAAQDVIHLFPLRDRMAAELEKLNRTEWMRQRCEAQLEAGLNGFATRGENAWRISGSQQLSARGLAILHELWHWRDEEARRADRPHFKIINDGFLMRLIEEAEEGGATGECLPPSLRRRFGRAIRRAVNAGRQRDPATLPSPSPSSGRPPPYSQEELRRQDLIRKVRNKAAAELNIDPSLLASRGVIGALSREPGRYREMLMPWQVKILEEEGLFSEIQKV